MFVELPSANTEAAAGNRGGFLIFVWPVFPQSQRQNHAPLYGASWVRPPLAQLCTLS